MVKNILIKILFRYLFRQNTRTWQTESRKTDIHIQTDTARRRRPRLCIASRGQKYACRPLASGPRVTSWRRNIRCRGRPAVHGRSARWAGTTLLPHRSRSGSTPVVTSNSTPATTIQLHCVDDRLAVVVDPDMPMTARIFAQSVKETLSWREGGEGEGRRRHGPTRTLYRRCVTSRQSRCKILNAVGPWIERL